MYKSSLDKSRLCSLESLLSTVATTQQLAYIGWHALSDKNLEAPINHPKVPAAGLQY